MKRARTMKAYNKIFSHWITSIPAFDCIMENYPSVSFICELKHSANWANWLHSQWYRWLNLHIYRNSSRCQLACYVRFKLLNYANFL